CSKLYSYIVNWTHAQVICEMDGGHLFVADTTEKIAILRKYCFKHVACGWVGATDILREDDWYWLNGVPVDRNMFKIGEPTNTNGDENCLGNFALTAPSFNDIPCSYKYYFMCEVPTKIALNQ
ncbi:hypothetical protein LOTGIDRAFT_102752, partial [Lottia gigantea]